MRCAIYTRKSVEDDFQKEQTSLESQRINCEKYAESRGWEILPTLYEDYGRTGANMDREGFQRLLSDIRAGKIDCVVVYKLDRLTRSLMDFVNVIDGFFKEHKVSFVSATESFDTTTPVGTLVMTLLVVFAQFERQQTSVRVKDKIRTSKTNGIWTGGFIPFGYKSVDRKLVLDEKTAPFVKSVFEDYLRNKSLYDIAQHLNLYRSTMEGTSVFTYAKLLALIRNPLYKGWISYKGELYKGQHEPLVSEEIWQQAHEKTRSKRCRHVTKQETQCALLKGIIRCEACDKSMIPFYAQKKKGQKYCYYLCLNKQKRLGCKGLNVHVNAVFIENLAIQEVRKILRDPSSFPGLWDYCEEHTKSREQAWIKMKAVDESWDLLTPQEQSIFVRSLLKNIGIREDSILMQLTTLELENILGRDLVISSEERVHNVLLEEKAALTHQRKTQAPKQAKPALTQTLPTVRKALLQAETWQNEIESGTYSSFEDLAQHYQVSSKTIIRYMVFNTLSPKVKEAILNDTLDPKFKIVDFTRKSISDDWQEQDQMFGVGG